LIDESRALFPNLNAAERGSLVKGNGELPQVANQETGLLIYLKAEDYAILYNGEIFCRYKNGVLSAYWTFLVVQITCKKADAEVFKKKLMHKTLQMLSFEHDTLKNTPGVTGLIVKRLPPYDKVE